MKKIFIPFVFLFYLAITGNAQSTFYVDASRPDNSGAGTTWATAKKDLQAAIIAASAGDQVWVKAGTYLPTHDPFGNTSPANNRDKSFTLKEGVKVYGGFAGTETQLSQRNWKLNSTVLSGDLGVLNTLTDNAYHVVLSVNLTSAAVLDGFTVTKGYATAPWQSAVTIGGRSIDRYKGAGIYNAHSSTQFSNLTITLNSADCTDQNDDAWGSGMVCDNSNSSISDCLFSSNSFLAGGNSFGVFGAGLMISGGSSSSNIVTRCFFVNNTSGSGIIAGSQGGALYVNAGAHVFTNCVFYANSAQNGAAIGFGGGEFNTSSFVNCTIANNTSDFAGTAYTGFSDAAFRNCIFWNNNPTSSSVSGRNEIFSQETRSQFWPTFTNCIIRDASGSPLSVTNTVTSNVLNGNPLFVNYSDGDGADNIWGTADDGLRLQCSSPAVAAGTGVTPATDLLGLTRTTVLDIGAYEGNHANSAVNPLPASQTTVQLAVPSTGATNFSNCTNLVASIQSGSPYTITGTVTTTVWVQGIQPSGYVKRHYQIIPASNAGSASARVTLYFTQQEFNDYNAVSAVDLPAGPADASGKANLLIEKLPGISSDGTGLPSSYTGSPVLINPVDTDIIWNSTAARWEISFEVTGFSGFFVKTASSTLPLRLISFDVIQQGGCNLLSWKTADEQNVRVIAVERSAGNGGFVEVSSVQPKNETLNLYSSADCSGAEGNLQYRLKITDYDGSVVYSDIIPIRKGAVVSKVYPNPVFNQTTVSVGSGELLHTTASLINNEGQILRQFKISALQFELDMRQLQPGIYWLRLADNSNIRIIKN